MAGLGRVANEAQSDVAWGGSGEARPVARLWGGAGGGLGEGRCEAAPADAARDVTLAQFHVNAEISISAFSLPLCVGVGYHFRGGQPLHPSSTPEGRCPWERGWRISAIEEGDGERRKKVNETLGAVG